MNNNSNSYQQLPPQQNVWSNGSLPTSTEVQNYLGTSHDTSSMSYIGWENTSSQCPNLTFLLSTTNLEQLQKVIMEQLDGVHPEGKRIIVSLPEIANVVSYIYQNGTRENIGDIYSRYIIPQEMPRNDIRSINNQSIQAIVNMLKTQFETEKNNKRLSVWNSVYGDFNKEGLRAHAPIKIRKKHPQYMAFNMNY